MPRGARVTYSRQNVGESPMDRVNAMTRAMRQSPVSAYAAQKFQEWQDNAPIRDQNLQLRNQILQSQAEMAGLKDREALYHQGEIDRQTKMYLSGMPVLREQLKQAGISPGDPRYAAEISAFAQHIPDAFTHVPEIQKRLTDLSKTDATAAEIAARAKTFQEGLAQAGLKGTSFSSTEAGNFDVKATRPIHEGLKSVNLSPTEFLNGVNHVQGKYDANGKFTQSLNPGEQATAIQFQAGPDPTNPTQLQKRAMPLQQFNNFRTDLGAQPLPTFIAPNQQSQGSVTAAPEITPTPTGIQTGTQRTINGQLAEWDGQGWSAVQQ